MDFQSHCDPVFLNNTPECLAGIPGFKSELFQQNTKPYYMKEGEVLPGVTATEGEVAQDLTTTFFVLLAIWFPAVTGIFTG